jgi:hypothetical protein
MSEWPTTRELWRGGSNRNVEVQACRERSFMKGCHGRAIPVNYAKCSCGTSPGLKQLGVLRFRLTAGWGHRARDLSRA